MGFTTPETFVVAQIVTAGTLNAQIRDNIRYLKGLDGTIILESGVESSGTSGYVRVSVLTTAQRDALTGTAGMLVYNSDTSKFNKYENGAWREDLAYNGTLTDMQLPGQTRGDILYCGTAGTAWERLPATGASGQFLQSQGTAANPQWADGENPSILLYSNSSGTGQTDNVTRYYALNSGALPNATELNAQVIMPRAGTLSKLYVYASPSADHNMSVTVRKNGTATAVTLTLTAGGVPATFSDLVNTAVVSGGDLVSVQVAPVTGTGGSGLTVYQIGIQCV